MNEAAQGSTGRDTPAERLFFALWPPAPLQGRIQRMARSRVRRGRLLPARNLHVTLVFLGSLAPAERTAALTAADRVAGQAFELVLGRFGCWRRRGIGWLAPTEVPAALERLHAELTARLQAAGFEGDGRVFRPHVTVARRASMTEETLTDGLVWRVDEFRLMRSERHADGASYSTVKAWRLGAAGVGGTP